MNICFWPLSYIGKVAFTWKKEKKCRAYNQMVYETQATGCGWVTSSVVFCVLCLNPWQQASAICNLCFRPALPSVGAPMLARTLSLLLSSSVLSLFPIQHSVNLLHIHTQFSVASFCSWSLVPISLSQPMIPIQVIHTLHHLRTRPSNPPYYSSLSSPPPFIFSGIPAVSLGTSYFEVAWALQSLTTVCVCTHT